MVKAVLRGKFIALNVYIRKKVLSSIVQTIKLLTNHFNIRLLKIQAGFSYCYCEFRVTFTLGLSLVLVRGMIHLGSLLSASSTQ